MGILRDIVIILAAVVLIIDFTLLTIVVYRKNRRL